MSKISNLMTTTGAIGVGYWLLDHSILELLPKPPRVVELSIVTIAVLLMIAGLSKRGWDYLVARTPRPWFPTPFWKVFYWINHRPGLAIISAIPRVDMDGATVSGCRMDVTLHRDMTRSRWDGFFDFDRVELVLHQKRKGRTHKWIFRPTETGGFLNRDVAAAKFDAIILQFTAMKLPMYAGEGPDFSVDFQFQIRGVRAELRDTRHLRGLLPPISWVWAQIYDSPALPGYRPVPVFGLVQ